MYQQNERPGVTTSQGNSSRRGRGRGLMFRRVQTSSNHDRPSTPAREPNNQQRPNVIRPPAPSLLAEYDNQQHLAWVNMLEHAWNLWKKGPSFQERLFSYFEQVQNPYMGALNVMLKSNDFRLGKIDSLAFTVMEDFEKWIQPKKEMYAQYLNPELKQFAFTEVCKQRNTSLIKMVCDIYECSTIKENFFEDIQSMLRKKDYKEACLCATFLGLNSKFTVEDFLIPLLFQDKINIVETFLKDDPAKQKEVVAYLDNLVGSFSIRNEVDAIIARLDIPHCKMDKLYYKPMSKLIARLVKMYDLKMESCPNFMRKRKRGVLSFLLKKRYLESSDQNQNSSLDSWREMVLDAAENDSETQMELIAGLDQYADFDEALFWAKKFNIDVERLPYNTQEAYKKKQACDSKNDEDVSHANHTGKGKEDTVDYHKLKIPAENIVMVSDAASFSKVLETGFNDVSLVGLDSEWKPVFCASKPTIALLQIATSSHVYIFDIISLQPIANYKDHWNQLGVKLFGNQNIIKLGFSLSTDLNQIKNLLPLGDVKLSGLGYLDLAPLWKRLVKEFSLEFPFKDDDVGCHESLSKLVTITLGKSLCKLDQFSNWEKRPLRQAQVEYAALDAYCLLEVYKVLEKKCEEQKIPFASLCQEIMSCFNSKSKPKKKGTTSKTRVLTMAPSPIKNVISVHDIKFVVDTMITGLGQQLRSCGIDTVILQRGDSHTKALDIAHQEKRMVLTRGQIYEKLYGCLAPGHCYRVDPDKLEDQFHEVLEYYKIIVREEDIFSRCKLCNFNEFSTYTRDDVKRILNWTPQLTVVTRPAHAYDDDQYDDFDDYGDADYGGFSDGECSDDGFVPGPSAYTPSTYACREQDDSFHENLKAEAEKIPSEILNRLDKFYSCNSCNKFYWDGSHLERELAKFSKLKVSSEIS